MEKPIVRTLVEILGGREAREELQRKYEEQNTFECGLCFEHRLGCGNQAVRGYECMQFQKTC